LIAEDVSWCKLGRGMTSNDNQHMEEPNQSLLLRYLNEETDAAETARVMSWLEQHPKNKTVLYKLAYIYFVQRTHSNIANRDPHRAFQQVYRRIRRSTRIRTLKRVAVAACLLIGLSGIGLFFYTQQAPSHAWTTIHAQDKLRTAFSLPDGTRVFLNSGSSLSYPSAYTGPERSVKLYGEAYFDVAHNAKQPFVVHTADDAMKIKVLGTEFTVTAYGDGKPIETTLVSGSVQLEIGEAPALVMKPAEKAIYQPQSNKLQLVNTDTEWETDWIHNRLAFRNTPMATVLERLVRYYGVEFDVKDDVIYSYHFTGVFEDKPLHHVLDYMRIASKISYTVALDETDKHAKTVVELRQTR